MGSPGSAPVFPTDIQWNALPVTQFIKADPIIDIELTYNKEVDNLLRPAAAVRNFV